MLHLLQSSQINISISGGGAKHHTLKRETGKVSPALSAIMPELGVGGLGGGQGWGHRYQGRVELPVLLSDADVQNDELARRQSQLVIS